MKKFAKALFMVGFLFILSGIVMRYKDDVILYVDQYLSPYKYVVLGDKNAYYRDKDFLYVQNTDNFIPRNTQDLINIYYTVINAGKNTFTFYCTDDYENCIEDVKNLANDQNTLSDINNYVHPYNGFSHIETEYDSVGRVTINIVKKYSDEEIQEINQKVEELSLKLINYNDSVTNNIKRVHDYIIDIASYDHPRADYGDTTYESDTAYGPLFQGKAVCSGYTDLMQLFLEKLDINNFRVSSEEHVWNALYINGEWLNLDLTWDDPVYSDGSNGITYDYFLVTTKQLKEKDQNSSKVEHNFDENHYLEVKEA